MRLDIKVGLTGGIPVSPTGFDQEEDLKSVPVQPTYVRPDLPIFGSSSLETNTDLGPSGVSILSGLANAVLGTILLAPLLYKFICK